MQHPHEPRDTFVGELERTVIAERRRRQQLSAAPWATSPWPARSRLSLGLAAAGLVVVSMAVGGAVVVAAYQAQASERRDSLTTTYEQRAALAREQLALAEQELRRAERRVATGVESQDVTLDIQIQIAEAEALVKSLELQLVEIRSTSREPLGEVSAPLVDGRDFVSERLEIELAASKAAAEVQKQLVQQIERRVAVGVASPVDAEMMRAVQQELQSAKASLEKKLQIRQAFLRTEVDADLASLRVLESEAEQRRATLTPRADRARKELQDIQVRFKTGLASVTEVAEAQLRLSKIQLDLAQANADLARIHQRIAQRAR
jgi:outer membrane protein TolC